MYGPVRALLSRSERAEMDALQAQLIKKYDLGEEYLASEIMALARRGVGYHHAGMLPLHKELVEQMFTSGLLRLLFTTETFALGINMPARTVAFSGLRKFDGVNFDYMRRRDFLQMAGPNFWAFGALPSVRSSFERESQDQLFFL